jgi:hypothetical protein
MDIMQETGFTKKQASRAGGQSNGKARGWQHKCRDSNNEKKIN